MNNLKSWWKTGLVIAGVCTLAAGCRDAAQQETARQSTDVTSEASANTVMSYADFKAKVYQEPGSGIYIANGDEQIGNEKQLREYYELNIKDRSDKDRATTSRSIVHTSGGADAKWSSSQKMNLTYCVSTSFGSNYNTAVQAMASAAQSWESAAGGNIDYIHVSSQDSNCTSSNNNVLFDVNPVNSGGQYLARAFFPDQGRSSRNVLVDNSAFSMSGSVTLNGVMRHELGHTLGLRHEHTRPEAGTCYEDNNWRALTTYDQSSVMHYPQCNGVSGQDLNITSKDQQGVQSLYGSGGGGGGGSTQTGTASGSVSQGQWKHYYVDTASGSTLQAVMTGSGDPDLYVRKGAQPTSSSFDCRPYLYGASESCNVNAGGRVYVSAYGYTSGSYSIQVTWTP